MRRSAAGLAMSFSLFSVASCRTGPIRPPQEENPAFILRLWVQDSPNLPKTSALEGCQMWRVKGVICVLTENEENAQVRVRENASLCSADKGGYKTLAWAHKGGEVVFATACFKRKGGTMNLHDFRAVFGHEIGHEIGVWNHVPERCGKDAPLHKSGKRICGKAVMNAYYDPLVDFVTDIDGLAFDMRSQEYSVLVNASYTPPELNKTPDCVYLGR